MQVRITLDEIQTGSLQKLYEVFARAEQEDALERLRGSLQLEFEQLPDEPIKLAQIPEVVRWFMELDQTYPHILYFLSPTSEFARYCAMFVPAIQTNNGLEFEHRELEAFLQKRLNAVRRFCTERGLEWKPVQTAIAEVFGITVYCTEEDPLPQVDDQPQAPPEFVKDWPFTPQLVSSPAILSTMSRAEIAPMIDIAGEPVLFAVVENPVITYNNPVAVRIELVETTYYPLLMLNLVVYDEPGTPHVLSFPIDVNNPRHTDWLKKAAQLPELLVNVLFAHDTRLYWAFTTSVELGEFGEYALKLLDTASTKLRLIPEEHRDYQAALAEYAKTLQEDANQEADDSATVRIEQEPRTESATVTIEVEAIPDDELVKPVETSQIKTPYDRSGKENPLRDSERIKKLEKLLNTSIVEPEKPVTEELKVKPAEKLVIKRDSMTVEQVPRQQDEVVNNLLQRMFILKSQIDTLKRENKILKRQRDELKEQVNALRRELELSKRSSLLGLFKRDTRKPQSED